MNKPYDVFISFKNLDEQGFPTRDGIIARELYEFLSSRGMNVFLSNITLEKLGVAAFKKAIDDALDSTQVLVVVGTSYENLNSQWVRYEWDGFLTDILIGVKKEGRIFCYLENLTHSSLPRGLRQVQIFFHETEAMQILYNFIIQSNIIGKKNLEHEIKISEVNKHKEDNSPHNLPTKIIQYNKIKLEQKTKLKRLSFGLSISDDELGLIDKNHKYEKIQRIDILDAKNRKYTSHRWLTLRNISDKKTVSIYHKESGDNKIRFKDMNFKAYESNRNGQRLHVKKLVELQPSFVQVVEIYFSRPLDINDVINIYYRFSWPSDSCSDEEHSESISLSRYLNGVSHLEFGILEINDMSSIQCIKVSNLYEEMLVNEKPIFFSAEDFEILKPIHGNGYKGFYYIFNNPDGIAYRIFYHLDKSLEDEKYDDF